MKGIAFHCEYYNRSSGDCKFVYVIQVTQWKDEAYDLWHTFSRVMLIIIQSKKIHYFI